MELRLTLQQKFKRLGALWIAILAISFSYAQSSNVKGIITGDGETLIGVNVLVKGTASGTVTDFNGAYDIAVSPNDTLVISYTGYEAQEIAVGNRTTLNIELQQSSSQLEEVVIVGYGTQTRKEVTGAVVSVDDGVISKTATADLGASLQGQVAGVNVQASSGRPGEAANIQIRGLGSVNAGALGPLYVVDGIPYEGNPNIAPEQIKSIDILKDGAAASVYGTRASNGVILITTKRGVEGEMKVSFNAYGGVQNITSGTPLMNAQQQLYVEEVRLEALGRETTIFTQNPRIFDFDSDFVGDVQNDNAPIQNYSLNVSGGIQGLTLNFNTNYFNQRGILISSGFDRLTNRITGQYTKGKFRAFTSIAMTRENTQQEPWALYENGISQSPWSRPLSEIPSTGENSFELDVDNDVLYSFLARRLNNIDERETNRLNVAINMQYEIAKGLIYKVNLGRNTWNYERKFF
ncbi:MAG: TonB-dependent receptor plug domain-containing protein, partial [Bacteroidota bacterium]